MIKLCSAAAAVSDIPDNAVVASVGVIGWITPDKVLNALGERFRKLQSPRDLTFYFPCGTGDAQGIKGMDAVAQPGLMKRIVSGSYINPVDPTTGQRPKLMQLIRENAIEAYSWPIGASMHWLREVARKSPGYMTEVGIGTYIDPDVTGGRFTAKAEESLVEKIEFKGKNYLFYPTWSLDVAIIRASSADEFGNLSFENEAMISSNIALAIATKACGGTVIAQVGRVVRSHTRKVSDVRIPGVLVDRIVTDPEQMLVTETFYDHRYMGGICPDINALPKLPFGPDKIIARRASFEVAKHELSIFGFGASSSVPLVMAEDGLFDGGKLKDYWFTTEHGSFGGVVMDGWQFSCNVYPEALLDGVTQFDLIDGGLCKLALLAFAQFDDDSHVNVSKFGGANPGAGGFIDIAQNAERLIFTGTFTTGGLKTKCVDGKLVIVREGKVNKFVQQAESITYAVKEGLEERGQSAKLITERAVFNVAPDGLELVEIAPGIDLQTQILDLMEFAPVRVSESLKLMATELFTDNRLGDGQETSLSLMQMMVEGNGR